MNRDLSQSVDRLARVLREAIANAAKAEAAACEARPVWEQELDRHPNRANCPNCDAILSYDGGLHCEYCGAWFEEPDKSDAIEFRDWAGRVVYTTAD